MCKQPLSRTQAQHAILKCLIVSSVTMTTVIGINTPVLAGGPNISCPTGTELVAKFNWTSGGYQFEKPSGNANVVTITGNANRGSWNTELVMSHVILKGATVTYTYQVAASSGNFSKTDFPVNGGGNQPDISNIQFCASNVDEALSVTPTVFTPAACDFIYGVHDDRLSDSQLIRIDLSNGFEIEPLGPLYSGHDIEAIDISPDEQLYVAAGDETDQAGYLYQANMITGELTEIGPTGFAELDGISFNPVDGTLWGWAQNAGLIRINRTTGESELVFAKAGEFEDITWNSTGTILYVMQNQHDDYEYPQNDPIEQGTHNPEPTRDAQVAHVLFAYNFITNTLDTICQNEIDLLVGKHEIEAIEVLPDDNLMLGYHKSNAQPVLATINPVTCDITLQEMLYQNQPYKDIEALAACPPQGLSAQQDCPPEMTNTDWMYAKDAFHDATGLKTLEIYGMAMKQEGDTIVVAINANMPAEGDSNLPKSIRKRIKDQHVGFSDLIFDFDGSKYAVHFALGNDSSVNPVTPLGLYTDLQLKDVTKENLGFSNLDSYIKHVKTSSLGDLPLPNSYFDMKTSRSVPMSIKSGTKVENDNYRQLSADELNAMGLDFTTGLNANANKLGEYTFGFSFTKLDEMTGGFTAYFFTECINDGIAMVRELPNC